MLRELIRRLGAGGTANGVIRKASGVCGGAARVRDTRIAVWMLVRLRQQGTSDVDILSSYPGLSQTDLDAAWRYYDRYKTEIDRQIALEESEVVC